MVGLYTSKAMLITDHARLIIILSFVLYILIAREIFKLRHELMLTRNDCLALSSTASASNGSIVRTQEDNDGKSFESKIAQVIA